MTTTRITTLTTSMTTEITIMRILALIMIIMITATITIIKTSGLSFATCHTSKQADHMPDVSDNDIACLICCSFCAIMTVSTMTMTVSYTGYFSNKGTIL